MISNRQLVDKLRERNFQFHDSTKRVHIYKQKGGPKRVTMNVRDWYDDDVACSYLRQTGMDPNAAAAWVAVTSKENANAAKKGVSSSAKATLPHAATSETSAGSSRDTASDSPSSASN